MLITFILAYILVSSFGFCFYLIISNHLGSSPWDEVEVRHNIAYMQTEKYLPLINLIVWLICTGIYFKHVKINLFTAFTLGITWLVIALLVDYIGFVLIKHPLSVDAKGFYIDQFPWIYLTYVSVFSSPVIYFLVGRHLFSKVK
jgi:hypothetical protein